MLNNYIDGAVDAVTVSFGEKRERTKKTGPMARASLPMPRPHKRPPLPLPSQDALIAGTVRRFAVLVIDQNGVVVERFVAALTVRCREGEGEVLVLRKVEV